MPERRHLLSTFLKLHGGFTILSGITWMVSSTHGRLAGVAWLDYIFSWAPVPVDVLVGIAWVACGILMIAGGVCGRRWRPLESSAFFVALSLPLLMAGVFLGAWWYNDFATAQYSNALSYLGFTTFLWAYLTPNKKAAPASAAEVRLVQEVLDDSR